MAFQNMIHMQLMMFLLVAVGFVIRRKEIIQTETRKGMVDFCIYVTLPFNIFHAFQMKWDQSMLMAFMEILLLSAGYNVISVLMSFLLYRKADEEKRKPLRYGTIVSNGGFLGNPVIEGIYGTEGLFYGSVFMFPVRVVMWTVGTACFMKEKQGSVVKKVLTHPCIAAIYLGLIVMITGIHLPGFVNSTVEGISNCNTPLSMMLVGMMLAEMNPLGLIDKTMIWYTGIRLLIIPGIIFALTAVLPINPLLRGVTVIMAGMPAPVTTALLSSKYGGDEGYATGMIFLTTILSMITLPIWCLLL